MMPDEELWPRLVSRFHRCDHELALVSRELRRIRNRRVRADSGSLVRRKRVLEELGMLVIVMASLWKRSIDGSPLQ